MPMTYDPARMSGELPVLPADVQKRLTTGGAKKLSDGSEACS